MDFRADLRRACSVVQGGGPLRKLCVALGSPGLHAIAVYRFGRWVRALPAFIRWLPEPAYHIAYLLVRVLWGIELPRTAAIGPGLYIGHFTGVIVSGRAVIGANCTLSQGVSIGLSGQGEKGGVPRIGDDVFIAPGAKVFGPIRVGNNAKIGANAVVYRDVPDNAVVVLDPGFRIVSLRGNRRTASASRAA